MPRYGRRDIMFVWNILKKKKNVNGENFYDFYSLRASIPINELNRKIMFLDKRRL